MASNELKSLENLFDGRFLRIPDYQRGYAWDKNQLNDFWEDLQNLKMHRIHYTGVITLEKVTQSMKDEKKAYWEDDIGANTSSEVFYIVDGQQRVTTSIILLKTILDRCNNENIKGIDGKKLEKIIEKYISEENLNGIHQYFFGYTADNPSYEFLKTKIFGDKSTSNDKKETLYTSNLAYAMDFFNKNILALTIEELEIIYIKLVKSFKFNLYEITDDLDVFVAFETMNNRGKNLSNLELLKNRLIYLSTEFNDKDKQILRTNINDAWKTIYEYLGRNKNNTLNDDIFLKNHWIMYHDYSRKKGDDYINDLLKERYTINRVVNQELSIKEIRDYVISLQNSVEHWYYLFNPGESNYDPKLKFLLDKLYRLNHGAFAPLLMAIFSRDENYDIDKVHDLLVIMERYIFLVFKISQRRSNTGDSDFFSNARKYYFSEIIIDEIIGTKDIDKDKCSGINWWLARYFDLNQFKLYLTDKFEKRDGYYSWNGLNYFLFEYELSLKGKNFENKINWSEYLNRKSDYISIEHVMPQTPDKQCWKDTFGEYTEKELKLICNSIGNLVPLSTSKNSKLQNNCFENKKEDGYKNGSYAEQEINEESNWTKVEIQQRGLKLLKFLSDNWDIEELNEEYLFI